MNVVDTPEQAAIRALLGLVQNAQDILSVNLPLEGGEQKAFNELLAILDCGQERDTIARAKALLPPGPSARPLTLATIERRRVDLMALRRAAYEAHTQFREATDAELARLTVDERMLTEGLDAARVVAGLGVIYIEGAPGAGSSDNFGGAPEWPGVITDAKADLAAGAKRLRREFFGTKNYAHFSHQRCDCSYGYGPRHGHIVFAVGLRSEFRGAGADSITPQQVEDAIYVLANIAKVLAARAAAKSAA